MNNFEPIENGLSFACIIIMEQRSNAVLPQAQQNSLYALSPYPSKAVRFLLSVTGAVYNVFSKHWAFSNYDMNCIAQWSEKLICAQNTCVTAALTNFVNFHS